MKHICSMTKEEFLDVPTIDLRLAGSVICKFIVIIPTTTLVGKADEPRFECRYNAMIIVAIDRQFHPICKIEGDIDLLSLYNSGTVNKKLVSVRKWRIDCLPTSGLLCFDTEENIKIYDNGCSLGIDGYIKDAFIGE